MMKYLYTILLATFAFSFSACSNDNNSISLEEEYMIDKSGQSTDPEVSAGEGADKLTLADMNAEAANMLAL